MLAIRYKIDYNYMIRSIVGCSFLPYMLSKRNVRTEEKMKERLKIILTGLGIIIFAVIGLWEYIQMFLYFDIPQAIVVMPIAGMVAAITLRKYCFIILPSMAAVSVVYQLVEDQVSFVGTTDSSKIQIILNIIPILVAFMLIGIGGGFLVRVLINRNKSRGVSIICCVLGIFVTFGGSLVLFHNPLYPFMARHAIHRYAEKYDSEGYKVSEVTVYFSYEELEYQGWVVMSDGVIYPVYHERETGKVYDLTDLS